MPRRRETFDLRMSELQKKITACIVLGWLLVFWLTFEIAGPVYKQTLSRAFTPVFGIENTINRKNIKKRLSYDDPEFQFEEQDQLTLKRLNQIAKEPEMCVDPIFQIPKYLSLDDEIVEGLTNSFKIAYILQCPNYRSRFYHKDILVNCSTIDEKALKNCETSNH